MSGVYHRLRYRSLRQTASGWGGLSRGRAKFWPGLSAHTHLPTFAVDHYPPGQSVNQIMKSVSLGAVGLGKATNCMKNKFVLVGLDGLSALSLGVGTVMVALPLAPALTTTPTLSRTSGQVRLTSASPSAWKD